MRKKPEEHDSSEFGQPASHGIKGLDPPMVGAPASITIDGIVEQESGKTPPPPAVSVKAIAITLAVMLILGVVILFALRCAPSFEAQMQEMDASVEIE